MQENVKFVKLNFIVGSASSAFINLFYQKLKENLKSNMKPDLEKI
jgi:hypothetical protein